MLMPFIVCEVSARNVTRCVKSPASARFSHPRLPSYLSIDVEHSQRSLRDRGLDRIAARAIYITPERAVLLLRIRQMARPQAPLEHAADMDGTGLAIRACWH
jgi:hypothetical protein